MRTDRDTSEGRPSWPALDDASLLPYVRALADLVEGRLGAGDPGLVLPSDDRRLDQALAVVLERLIEDRLTALPPEQVAGLYRQLRGHDALAARLEELARFHQAEVERLLRLARMRQAATISARLDLAEVPAGEVLTIGLFDPGRPELAAYRFRENVEVRPLHRVWAARMIEPVTGEVELIRDRWVGAVWSDGLRTPAVPPFTAGRLGRADPREPGVVIPELTRLAPAIFRADDGTVYAPPQVVGYVATEDDHRLLDQIRHTTI